MITRQVKVVEVLLRAGADPSLLDKDGRTPLHLAALAGDNSMLRLLLAHLRERHAHLINTPDYHGETRSLKRGDELVLMSILKIALPRRSAPHPPGSEKGRRTNPPPARGGRGQYRRCRAEEWKHGSAPGRQRKPVQGGLHAHH